MTLFKLGYVAMSMELQNASPSQTMTFKQFSAIPDKEAAIRRLERIAYSNLENCLRLLKHNVANDIHFFRFSSKIIPLVNHPEVEAWNYIKPLKPILKEIGEWVKKYSMRVDFHPDHFVILNSSQSDILKNSLKTLVMHEKLLKGMGIDPEHRCVLHVGGAYEDKELAMEQFITNWGFIPPSLQKMIILENDDTTFTVNDALYLCEKLQVPCVFDLHHHMVNNDNTDWEDCWERICGSWSHSTLPLKMHISSPRSEADPRAHADYIDPEVFYDFAKKVDKSIPEVHCMIEAKKKDEALFQLVGELKKKSDIQFIDESTFTF
ncbi:UV DNA damage repair endonuclease UvsE [Bacillus sp. B1-b2]|uniref:UV DNA damage repair endonuclease UvsE n=1 Tax=Bacillus sp. B1-b2 TaxID=2653201 RepID=UPI0012613D2B|nr:UV DNA damage repair endonuclease UvsE [Bacillus sp. B1-b2]KAB7663453.1 UV DNA damage repair endonuclease UvsE [Bacillus sp. B1-b2]